MMKRYKIKLPTQEQCTSMGLKFEGQEVRTRLWLMGVAWAIKNTLETRNRFAIICLPTRARNHFLIDTNSDRFIGLVEDYLASYGCTTELQDASDTFRVIDTGKMMDACRPKA